MKQWITVLAILVTAAGAANAAITFSEYPVGTIISNQYAPQGVLFLPGTETPRLPQISWDGAMPTEPVLRPTGEPDLYVYNGDFLMQFTAPAVTGVTFISGFWDDVGTGIVDVYDPSMNLLASLSNTGTGVEAFNISGLGYIGYVYFNSIHDAAGADIDNLAFCQIPAPGALLLGSLGMGLVGWMRRRRSL
jgi:hypothetical protein